MESINSHYTCNKCEAKIYINNKLLHDNMCVGVIEFKENLDRACYFDYIENKWDFNDNKINSKNGSLKYPSFNEIIRINTDKNMDRKIESKLNNSDEYKFCNKCDNFLHINEYEDHLMCHCLQDKLEHFDTNCRSGQDDLNKNFEMNENHHEMNNNNFFRQISSNNDILFKDCDLIEDKEEILKEIEEDKIFKRKFEEKKNSVKKSKEGIMQNTLSYLFDIKFRRVPPIVRLIGAIFDRRQLIRLAEDEIAARIATRLIQSPKQDDKGDEEILFSLIPEIKIEDIDDLPLEKRECVICGEAYQKDHKISNLPCLHTFHSHCIKEWFKQKNLCPICKYQVTKENFE